MPGRPTRTWRPKTYTVSLEVAKAIAARAAELEVDPGTIVDVLIWEALLKPAETRLRAGSFSEDELERLFAEEVLALLQSPQSITDLAEALALGDTPIASLRMAQKLVKRWMRTRNIDKEHQQQLLTALDGGNWVPSILRVGLVEQDWFDEGEVE